MFVQSWSADRLGQNHQCLLPRGRLKAGERSFEELTALTLWLESYFHSFLFLGEEIEARPGRIMPGLETDFSTLSAAPGFCRLCVSLETNPFLK